MQPVKSWEWQFPVKSVQDVGGRLAQLQDLHPRRCHPAVSLELNQITFLTGEIATAWAGRDCIVYDIRHKSNGIC